MSTLRRMNRRQFLRITGQGIAAAGLGSMLMPRPCRGAVSPNEKVVIAVIGCGGMGTRHIEALSVNPNCTIAAVCDCFKPRYGNAVGVVEKLSGKKPDGCQDFRQV